MTGFRVSRDAIQQRFNSPEEREMQKVFVEAADQICRSVDVFEVDPQVFRVGFELEYSILDRRYNQCSQRRRDRIISQFPSFCDKELGASQLEMRIGPIDILSHQFGTLEEEYAAKQLQIERALAVHGYHLLRSGTNPFVSIAEVKRTAKVFKYKRCPDFHNQYKRKDINTVVGSRERVDVGDADCISLFNACHINIDSMSCKDAIDKLNRSLMLSPMMIAIGANGRLLDLKDTGIADIRFIAWEISHDIRTPEEVANGDLTRVGMPDRYYTDMNDYFNRILEHPFVLGEDPSVWPHSFEVGIGLNWRDARIKFLDGLRQVAVVEFRPLPMQPTLEEDLAMTLFYLGRLTWSQQTNEELIPIDDLIIDKANAMNHGLLAELHFHDQDGKINRGTARDFLPLEFSRTAKGLRSLGMSRSNTKRFYEVLLPRLEIGTPADQLSFAFYQYRQSTRTAKGAMIRALSRCIVKGDTQ